MPQAPRTCLPAGGSPSPRGVDLPSCIPDALREAGPPQNSHLVVHHAALVQNVWVSAVEKLDRSIEVAQRPDGVPQRRPCLPSSLPAIRLQRIGLREHDKSKSRAQHGTNHQPRWVLTDLMQSLPVGYESGSARKKLSTMRERRNQKPSLRKQISARHVVGGAFGGSRHAVGHSARHASIRPWQTAAYRSHQPNPSLGRTGPISHCCCTRFLTIAEEFLAGSPQT